MRIHIDLHEYVRRNYIQNIIAYFLKPNENSCKITRLHTNAHIYMWICKEKLHWNIITYFLKPQMRIYTDYTNMSRICHEYVTNMSRICHEYVEGIALNSNNIFP